MKFFTLFGSVFLLAIISGHAQEVEQKIKPHIERKGKFFCYWGYNRSVYSKSDITFSGEGYNFTVHKAKATDRPTAFTLGNYFRVEQISVPQYNYRIGCFFTNNFAIGVGMDHMKYVFITNQNAGITGEIDESASSNFFGTYNNTNTVIPSTFLKFEHTDGLNNLALSIEYLTNLLNRRKINIESVHGLGAGLLIPRSDVTVFGKGKNNKFHIAGVGADMKSGLRFNFFRHLFFEFDSKFGYITLPNILTEGTTDSKASQHFWYFQYYGVLGFTINSRQSKAK